MLDIAIETKNEGLVNTLVLGGAEVSLSNSSFFLERFIDEKELSLFSSKKATANLNGLQLYPFFNKKNPFISCDVSQTISSKSLYKKIEAL